MVSLKKTVLQAQNKIVKKKKGFSRKLVSIISNKWQVVGIILVGFFLLLPGLVVAGYQIAYLGKVYPGVAVADVTLGNRTEQDAERALNRLVEKANKEQPALTLISEGNQWHILKADIGFSYLPRESARLVYMIGRKDDWLTNLNTQWSAWFKGINLPLEYTYDEILLEERVASIAAELDLPPIPPTIEIEYEQQSEKPVVLVKVGESGLLVKQGELVAEIKNHLAWRREGQIAIPVEKVAVNVSADNLAKTRSRAEKLLGKKLLLSADEQAWSLADEEIINFIDFEGGYDDERVAEYLGTLKQAVDRPAQDAAFQYVGGRVTEFRSAKDGLTLNIEAAVAELLTKLTQLEEQEEVSFSIAFPLERAGPSITLADVNDLGIKELLGRGTSTYFGSIKGRIYNVGLSAKRVSGVLVPPGNEFSFNASVGDISGATGYKPAYIIKGGSTVLDDGGGVCQSSTTVFRAALDAGLPITQRRAHSYRVGYYEQNAKPGLDATVYAPRVDLKFLNDTPAHILVQTTVNGPSGLIVEIYGTSDGRQSQIANHKVWDVVPAPPPRYQDDPTLPAGAVKQIDYAASGAKAKFDYIVTRDGETIYSKTFYSNFRPWQAVYLRGV